mmetsp:Transcript_88612/g.143552  ORF Transcript_88612/g.143552 Transcript_88612/m.143552 type:complete len:333 (-) Transcript_88612:317-1315(-)
MCVRGLFGAFDSRVVQKIATMLYRIGLHRTCVRARCESFQKHTVCITNLTAWCVGGVHRRANIGTLCMIDSQPGTMDASQKTEVDRYAMQVQGVLQRRIDVLRLCHGAMDVNSMSSDTSSANTCMASFGREQVRSCEDAHEWLDSAARPGPYKRERAEDLATTDAFTTGLAKPRSTATKSAQVKLGGAEQSTGVGGSVWQGAAVSGPVASREATATFERLKCLGAFDTLLNKFEHSRHSATSDSQHLHTLVRGYSAPTQHTHTAVHVHASPSSVGGGGGGGGPDQGACAGGSSKQLSCPFGWQDVARQEEGGGGSRNAPFQRPAPKSPTFLS